MVNKILYYALLAFSIFVTGMFFHVQPVHAEPSEGVSLLNVTVYPLPVKVGDSFSINATIANNSNDTISVLNGCKGPFSVDFDSHAQSGVKKVCNWMAIQIILKPGQSFNATSLASNLDYTAISTGSANATVTVSYQPLNSSGLPNNVHSISTPVSFTIVGPMQSGDNRLPPLQQIRSGVLPNNVQCNEGLELVFKASDGSPNCVKPSSIEKLVSRGWAEIKNVNTVPSPETSVQTITLEDNGKSMLFHKDTKLLLDLGSNFNWSISIDNSTVVSRLGNMTVGSTSQSEYETHESGSATLTGVGDPPCRSLPIPCMIHSVLFRLNIIVE